MSKALQPIITRKIGCGFEVVSEGQSLSPAFATLPWSVEGITQEVVRITGGCKGISKEIADAMPEYFLAAFAGYTGTLFSGGTANYNGDGSYKGFMVTNVPSIVANKERCLACSTTPRTADMALTQNHGAVIVDAYGTQLDHSQHRAAVIQKDPAEVLDWNGDLGHYFRMMEAWRDKGVNVAIIALNGGGVTKEEIYGALARRIPVIAVEGSGRETDVFIAALRAGTARVTEQSTGDEIAVDASLVSIVPLGDADALRKALVERGMVVAPVAETDHSGCCGGKCDVTTEVEGDNKTK